MLENYLTSQNQHQVWDSYWNNFSDEEKWKARVVLYNSGQSCVGDALIATNGQATNWDDIADKLGEYCTSAAGEVNGVWENLK